jgi:hypothetical protein
MRFGMSEPASGTTGPGTAQGSRPCVADEDQRSRLHYALGGIVFVVVIVWSFLGGGTRASRSFYEIGAQVIPVLIVALAVEREPQTSWKRWPRSIRVQLFAALVAGEAAALTAVALGRDTVASTASAVETGTSGSKLTLSLDDSGEYLVEGHRFLTDFISWLTVVGLCVGFIAVAWSTLLAGMFGKRSAHTPSDSTQSG